MRLNGISLIAILLCFNVFGQNSNVNNLFQSNSILDISDLRPSLPNQFFKQVFVRDSTYTFEAVPGVPNEWVLEYRTINAYDNLGRRTTIEIADRTPEGWASRERIINAYNDDLQIGVRQTLLWNDTLSTWINSERKSFTYNPYGLEYEFIVAKWMHPEWVPSERHLKYYNLNDQLETDVQYTWLSQAQAWEESTRMLYTYNAQDLVEMVTVQIWVDSTSTWINYRRNTYEYDEDEKVVLTTFSSWDPMADDFTENSFIAMVYNDKGQISSTRQIAIQGPDQQGVVTETANYDPDGNLDDVLQTIWDEDSQEWENYKRHEHYWSRRYIGNLDSNPEEITCVFANPYETGEPWYCESLKKDVVYNVEVYDLHGRSFYQQYIMGGYSFRVDGNIPPGFYLVVISGGLDVHTEKVVIR
jgi:hypothetical protein